MSKHSRAIAYKGHGSLSPPRPLSSIDKALLARARDAELFKAHSYSLTATRSVGLPSAGDDDKLKTWRTGSPRTCQVLAGAIRCTAFHRGFRTSPLGVELPALFCRARSFPIGSWESAARLISTDSLASWLITEGSSTQRVVSCRVYFRQVLFLLLSPTVSVTFYRFSLTSYFIARHSFLEGRSAFPLLRFLVQSFCDFLRLPPSNPCDHDCLSRPRLAKTGQ